MSEKITPRTLKGFKDYNPLEQRLRQKIVDTAREVFELYGFVPLDTPALEYAEILEQKYGEEEKLIYKFKDRGGREVAMRYDLTVPLARYVAENFNDLKLPFRRYQIGLAWRADNPQKGRFREFMQADADVVGVESLTADAEAIAVLYEILKRLGIPGFKVYINSRKIFDALGEMLEVTNVQLTQIIRVVDKLDKIGIDAVTDTFRKAGLSDGQVSRLQAYLSISTKAEPLSELAAFFENTEKGQRAVGELMEVNGYLKNLGVPEDSYVFDPSIARGLDYYTGTVFEPKVPRSEFGSLGSGGRYDNLVESLLGKKIPAVGASLGVDRVLALMLEIGDVAPYTAQVTRVLVMNLGPEFSGRCMEVLAGLRRSGVAAQYFYDRKDLDKQFNYAESLNIPYAILIGEEEIKNNKITLRNLTKREQKMVSLEEVIDSVTKS